MEICLACHHRIVVDDNRIQLGLPEVTLVCFQVEEEPLDCPVCSVWSMPSHIWMEGKKLRPQQALRAGFIHELVDTVEDLIPAAKSWF